MKNSYMKVLVSIIVLLPLLTACPRTTTPVTTPEPNFSLGAGDLSIEEGATGTVTITITANEAFEDEVVLGINNPEDVTATFSPASTKTTSTLTLGSNQAGTFDMVVTGKSGTIEKTTAVKLTVTEKTVEPPPAPTTITVTGKATDSFGSPLTSAVVLILGQDAPNAELMTTAINDIVDSSGNFSLANVKKPYDIVLLDNSIGHATIYQGLTTETPELTSFVGMQAFYNFPRGSKLGKFAGTTDELPVPDHDHAGVFGSPEALRRFSINNNGNLGGSSLVIGGSSLVNSSVEVPWYGPDSTSGAAHVLQWKKNTKGLPDKFTGYGSLDLTLTDGATIGDLTIPMQILGTGNVSGSVSVPEGYFHNRRFMSVSFDENSHLNVATEYPSKGVVLAQESLSTQQIPELTSNFFYNTPLIGGAKIGIAVGASTVSNAFNGSTFAFDGAKTVYLAKAGIKSGDLLIDLVLPEAPSLALPANNASNVSFETEFSWAPSGFSETVNVVFIDEIRRSRLGVTGGIGLPIGGTGNSLSIVTAASKVKIPDLSSIGITLNSPTAEDPVEYRWSVESIGPFSTVDSAATSDFGDAYYSETAAKDVFYGRSQSFIFKVATP